MPKEYQAPLFGCCSPFDLCIKSFCCPCVVAGRNHHRISNGTDEGYSTFNAWCAGWCCLTHVGHWGWILQFMDRQDMMDKNDLSGSACTNCLTTWCCTCCELIQTKKELDYIALAKSEQAGYQAQPAMQAVPQ